MCVKKKNYKGSKCTYLGLAVNASYVGQFDPWLPVNTPGASSHRQRCFHSVKRTTHLDTAGPMKLHLIALDANLKVLANVHPSV